MGMASTGAELSACSSSSSADGSEQSCPAAFQRLIIVFMSGLSRSARSALDRRIPHSVAGPAGNLPALSSGGAILRFFWLARSVLAESEEWYSTSYWSSHAVSSPQSETGAPWRMAGPGNVESSYSPCFRSYYNALRAYHVP